MDNTAVPTVPEQSEAALLRIKKMSNMHHSILDWMLLNPEQSMRNCADHFGITQSWLSCIVNSGCFKAEYTKRRGDIASVVSQDLPLRLQTVSHLALDNIARHLERSSDPKFALEALDSAMKGINALTPKTGGGLQLNVNTQNNVQQLFASPEDLQRAREALRLSGAANIPALPIHQTYDADSISAADMIEVSPNGQDTNRE